MIIVGFRAAAVQYSLPLSSPFCWLHLVCSRMGDGGALRSERPEICKVATYQSTVEVGESDLRALAAVLSLGAITSLLDTTIINVAIDSLGRQFRAPVTITQWIITGYMLSMSLVIPLTAWAAERFGTKTMWISSLGLFLVGSLLCGIAWSVVSLIAFRVLQGLGGGMILPLCQTILAQAAGPRRFGKAMAFVAIPGQLAPIVGPVAGGWMLHHLSWHWIFLINIPIGCVAMILAWRRLPAGYRDSNRRLDVAGFALLSPALPAIVYGLATISDGGVGAVPVLVLSIGAILLGGFVIHALNARTSPIIDLRLFRRRSFALSANLIFLIGLVSFGAMFLMPLFEQQVRGHNAFATGLLLAPQGLGMMLALPFVGRAIDRLGSRLVAIYGITIMLIGTSAFAQLPTARNDGVLSMFLVIRGAGVGAAGIAVLAAAYLGLRENEFPGATATLNGLQRIGGSFGTAVMAGLLQLQASTHTPGHLMGDGIAAAFCSTFRWCLLFTAIGLLPAWLLPVRSRSDNRVNAEPPSQASSTAPSE
jgi:EmrB/QacA subfamily drug resistance transporter